LGPSVSEKQVTAAYAGDRPAPTRPNNTSKTSLHRPRTASRGAGLVRDKVRCPPDRRSTTIGNSAGIKRAKRIRALPSNILLPSS
jgi:hypothetical protein